MIALDCDSGGVLGMASAPTYDLNDYSKVIDKKLLEKIDKKKMTESDALYEMWRNKAL